MRPSSTNKQTKRMKKRNKSKKKKKGAKRITADEAKRNKEDKIRNFKFFILTVKDRDTIWKLVAHFKNRRISMVTIGKNETTSADGIFFFKTVNNPVIMADLIHHFGAPAISMASIGSFLENIITKEGYFTGIFQKGY